MDAAEAAGVIRENVAGIKATSDKYRVDQTTGLGYSKLDTAERISAFRDMTTKDVQSMKGKQELEQIVKKHEGDQEISLDKIAGEIKAASVKAQSAGDIEAAKELAAKERVVLQEDLKGQYSQMAHLETEISKATDSEEKSILEGRLSKIQNNINSTHKKVEESVRGEGAKKATEQSEQKPITPENLQKARTIVTQFPKKEAAKLWGTGVWDDTKYQHWVEADEAVKQHEKQIRGKVAEQYKPKE